MMSVLDKSKFLIHRKAAKTVKRRPPPHLWSLEFTSCRLFSFNRSGSLPSAAAASRLQTPASDHWCPDLSAPRVGANLEQMACGRRGSELPSTGNGSVTGTSLLQITAVYLPVLPLQRFARISNTKAAQCCERLVQCLCSLCRWE